MTGPEFSRSERIDLLGAGDRSVRIAAGPDERAALAERFGLLSVERLEAAFEVHQEATGIVARGTVSAAVVQACSVTDDPVPATVDEAVALRFVEEDAVDTAEIELSGDALDTMFYSGGTIDLGEAAAETLALALDPFPRGPNAAAALRAAGVLSEDELKPADKVPGALAGLGDLFGKR